MRITTILLFITILFVSAKDSYAQNARVNINRSKVALSEVLDEIESQTDYLFLYNNQVDVNRKVSVKAKSKPVRQVLDDVFKNTDTYFAMEGTHIVLTKNEVADLTVVEQTGRTVTVVVTDDLGEVIGANVTVKGTTIGNITDAEGKVTLQNVPNDAIIVVSYVGYITQEINSGNQTLIHIDLKEDLQTLDEVVVIGYGTAKKSDLTGAVSSLKGDALAKRSSTQVSTALQGLVPGLMVTRSNSNPASNATIRIRGITTIGDSNPLVIVDGVPGDMGLVHADDIESISVLKDAASASIYGSRAAAGVIMITTKRAKTNDLSLTYNYEYGLEIPTSQPKNVTMQRYLEMTNELKYNDNPAGGLYQFYSQDQVENWVKMNPTNPDNYPITDWSDLLIRNNASRQSHSLSFMGGSKVVRTKASINYDEVGSLLAVGKQDYNRYLIRINNDFTFNKYLSATLDLNVRYVKHLSPVFDPWSSIRAYSPAYAWQWSHGGLADVKGGNNPYGRLRDGGHNKNQYANLGGKVSLDFTPFKDLKISVAFSPNYAITKNKSFRTKAGFTGPDDPNTIIGYFQDFATTKLTETRNDNHDLTSQFLVNYTKDFGNHNLNLMAGYENYYYFNEGLATSRDQYELTEFPYLNIGPTTYMDNSGSAYENAYRSFFGRIMYSYGNRYLFQANVRHDGSSRFHKDHRWGTFPSFSAGWVLSEESFMKDASLGWLSFLKLRTSWGTLGNERIGNYPYISLMDFTRTLFYQNQSATSPTYYNGAAQIQYAIEDISWETTESFDIGIDVNFLNNRLRFTGDYYVKKTKDMLLALQIPGYLGFDNPDQNTGKMDTKGFDLEIGWNDHAGDFNYNVSLNLSDFTSKMGDLGGTQFLGSKVRFQGSYFDEWYGYKADGLFLTQEDLDNSAKLNNSIKVGDIKYKDISGPDGVPDGVISPEYDRILLGNSQPRFMYGGNFAASYKGIDASLSFQGVGKQLVRLTSGMVQPLQNEWGSIPGILDGNYWSSFNTDEENARAKYPRLTYINQGSNNSMSDFWIFNGRYFRMKNLTVGYTLPSALTQKVSMKHVRLYVTASDLFCFSKYPTGWDPERGESSYPITTSVIFGLSVNF